MFSSSEKIWRMLTTSEGVAFEENLSSSIGENVIYIGSDCFQLDDANAADRMTGAMRHIFWSNCTDNALRSDAYSQYAASVFNDLKIDINSMHPFDLKCFI